jgi:ATP-binding cassette subfamily C (CFTR/MRP) protein 1
MQFDLSGDGSDPSRQTVFQPAYDSGSFTGHWHPPAAVYHKSGYLTATEEFKQPLCANAEGWGPLSKLRYDFTPCFLDVWLASVATFGLVFGLAAVVWLRRKKKPVEVGKGWQFWTKQVRANMELKFEVPLCSDLANNFVGCTRLYLLS